MATTAKNFRIKQGLVVEGTTGTINGQNILTETGSDTYILNLIGGETLVKSVSSDFKVTVGGELQIDDAVSDLARTGDITSAINDLDTSDIEEGATNLYFTNQRALDATASAYDAAGAAATAQSNAEDYADGLASNYDPAGAAATAQSNAEDYADGLAVNYDPAGAAATAQSNAEDYADGLASNYDPAGAAATAQSNAEDYADGLASNYDAAGAASTAETNAKNYADDLIGDPTVDGTGGNTVADRIASAVSDLVGTAPAVLDTLQELAEAIGNDVNLVDGIGVAIGNKLPLAGGSMTGNIAMGSNLVTGLGAPSSDNDAARKKYVDDTASTAQSNAEDYADGLASNYDPAGAAATAQSNAEDYADGLASNYDPAGAASTAQSNAEGYTDTTVGNILDGDTAFTALNVNNVSGTYAATSTVATAGTATAWSFDSTVFTSAKLLVKFKTATHTQVSEFLLTLDASGNIATTEYAEVGTNGSLGTVTAINTAGTVNIRVTTAYNATDVMVYATALI